MTPIIFEGPMGQKGEKSIMLNPPNKTQTYPRKVLLSLKKNTLFGVPD